MKCREFEPIITRMARGQLLETGLRAQVITHTEACALCASKLASHQLLANGVAAVVESLAEQNPSAHVESVLRSAFRAQQIDRAIPRPQRAPHRVWWLAAATAAVVLIALSAIVVWQRPVRENLGGVAESTTSPITPAAPPDETRPGESSSPEIAQSEIRSDGTASPPRSRRKRKQTRRDKSPEGETTTDFFLLADSDQYAPLESGQLVRVEVPLSMLGEGNGNADLTDRVVKADVVIGQDGLARAIRFVR